MADKPPGSIANRKLMELHVDALFVHDAAGDLVRVNEPNGARAPQLFLGTTAHGTVLRFRADVDADTRRELAELGELAERDVRTRSLELPVDPSPYAAILARYAPVQRTETGPAFCFPDQLPANTQAVPITSANADLLHPLFEAWTGDVHLCQPFVALVADGHAVSLCASVRLTDAAYEAGIETAPAYRGRGYAAQVATAWARAVRAIERVPLYSTSWNNEASRAVARKAGLILFGADVHIT